MQDGFLSGMSSLNKIALGMFLLAKLCGFIGIILGFFSGPGRFAGGIFLALAFICLILSVLCSVLQASKEAKKFEKEDEEKSTIRSLMNKRKELEDELKDLEARKNTLMSLSIRHGRKI